MLQNTRGIALRAVKYGDTSLVCTIFTESYGIQSYMMQGVRSARAKHHRAGLLQPATLLDIVVYHKPQQTLGRIRELQPHYIYQHVQEDVVRNSVALFSCEVLLRILPEHAPAPDIFDFAMEFFKATDTKPLPLLANFPLWFIIRCSRLLGYNITGAFTGHTPYLNAQEGAFVSHPPPQGILLHSDEVALMAKLLALNDVDRLSDVEMNANTRNRLLDWLIEFLHHHTQHMGAIRSLEVLRAILH
jgi:DNA repair protein RecO (recombination protein O)